MFTSITFMDFYLNRVKLQLIFIASQKESQLSLYHLLNNLFFPFFFPNEIFSKYLRKLSQRQWFSKCSLGGSGGPQDPFRPKLFS